MANVNSPFGAVPVGTTDGSDYHAKLREVEFLDTDSVPAFLNDWVKLTGTTGVDGFTPVVAQAAAGDKLIGSIVEFLPDFDNESFINAGNNRLASTARKARICWGSDVLYVSQSSTTLVAADAGQNADIVVGTGDTITGVSGGEIGAVIAAGATGQLRLHNVRNIVGNEIGVDAQWVVSINENQDDHGTGV